MDIGQFNQIVSSLGKPLTKKQKNTGKKSQKASPPQFQRLLDATSSQEAGINTVSPASNSLGRESDMVLTSLLDAVYEKGEALKRHPLFGELKDYKKAVQRFLQQALAESLQAEEVLGIRNSKTMEQKKYTTIRVVNKRLEALVSYVLKGQVDQLEILRRVDEVNGLLVDFTG